MTEITLHHGNCLEIMKEIANASIDLIICDLPFGCLKNSSSKNGCTWDVKIDLDAFWKEIKRIRRSDHSPCIHFCTTKFGYDLINSNPSEFRYDLVWNKNRGVSFLTAGKMPLRSHEMIYVFSKAGAYYHRMDDDAPGRITKRVQQDGSRLSQSVSHAFRPSSGILSATIEDGKKCVTSVVSVGGARGGRGKHPTEKPVELYKWLIQRYCPDGGTVLDPTFGSANSVCTAYQLGRNAIGIEMNETFFKKAVERLELL